MTAKSGNESVSLTGPVVGQGGTAGHLPGGHPLREFVVDRVLGEGGFSVVYVATDTRLERQVAIKEYMPTALATRNADLSVHVRSSAQHREAFEAGLRSFINEAKLLARFEHRALVKVHQFWQEKGTAYMVMPYYSGPTLKAWVKQQHDPIDSMWLEQFLRLVMDAVETLHKENCLHRDVAPDNILILNERSPLLLDFGAARRVIGDMTQALTVILKPGFAPIEQYAESQSMRQGPWTDVYALCAVAHFMITGRAPTPSVTRVLADDLVPLRVAAEGRFPPAFLAALDAGLTVRPQQRPQSIAVLRDLMNGAVPDDTLTAPPGTSLGTLLSPGSVPATVRPMPFLGEADNEDEDEKTRVVSTRELPNRTAPNTISSPIQPALAAIEPETTPNVTGDPTFGSRFPSRSMREHEAAVTEAPVEPVDEDKGSHLPLILGGLAIAAVIGGAWAMINWLDAQSALSRSSPAPAAAPAPAPSSVISPPAVIAAAPAPAPVHAQAPPAPAAAPPLVAVAPPKLSDDNVVPQPAATKPEAAPSEKLAASPTTQAAAVEPSPAPVAVKSAPTPANKPVPPSAMASTAAPPPAAPMKSAPPAPVDARPAGGAMASNSKSGPPPSSGEPARARVPSAQPASTPYNTPASTTATSTHAASTSAPMSESPSAPPVSVPSVKMVDANPPPQMAAVEPTRPMPAPAQAAALKAISRPQPMFPREALRANVDKGRVTARLFVASDGSVSKVEILSSQPARVFDREVRDTVLHWRFEAPGQPRQADVEFDFDRFKER